VTAKLYRIADRHHDDGVIVAGTSVDDALANYEATVAANVASEKSWQEAKEPMAAPTRRSPRVDTPEFRAWSEWLKDNPRPTGPDYLIPGYRDLIVELPTPVYSEPEPCE